MAAVLFSGVAFALLLGMLEWTARAWAAPVMVVAVLALGAFYARVLGLQAGLVLLLVVTALVDRYTFRLGPVDIRAEEIAGVAAVCVLAITKIREGGREWLKPNLAEALLLAWFACNVVGSVLSSPDKRLSAKILLLIGVCSIGFFLPRRLLAGAKAAENFETVTRWLLVAFAIEATFGSFAYVLHVYGPTIALTPNPASGHLSAYGTLWEQNVFGAVTAAGGVAWVYLGPGRFRWAWLSLAVCMAGVVASLTRAAWLAAAVVGGIGVTVPGLRRRFDVRLIAIGLFGGLIMAAGVLVLDSTGTYTVQVKGGLQGNVHGGLLGAILNLTDFIGRLNQMGPVWADIHGREVLFGRGTDSFEALHVVDGVPQHIASLPLQVLNDTGVVGLAVFTFFVLAVGMRAWAHRKGQLVAAFGQVAVVVGLTNLATQTTELMIGWLLIGLLAAACDNDSVDRSDTG